jgi:hypothetical protein
MFLFSGFLSNISHSKLNETVLDTRGNFGIFTFKYVI